MTEPTRPVLRVIAGNPNPEELAAVTVVLTLIAGAGSEPTPDLRPSGWSSPEFRLRQSVSPGPGAWRASTWRPSTSTGGQW